MHAHHPPRHPLWQPPLPEADDDDAPTLPCPLVLIAANVALMSAYANPTPELATCGNAAHRRSLLARKVVSNLFFLRQHPALPPPLRQVMTQAHQHWLQVLQADQEKASVPASACVSAPGAASPANQPGPGSLQTTPCSSTRH